MKKKGFLERVLPGLAMKRELASFHLNQLQAANKTMESMPEWATDTDESQWFDLNNKGSQYTEEQLQTMWGMASRLYRVNPSARGLIDSEVQFIIGKECKTTAVDLGLQEFWLEFTKVNEFDKRKKEIVKRTLRDGEVFIRMFKPKSQVSTTDNPSKFKVPLMRFIDVEEIRDPSNKHSYGIETDPNDVETPINYYRTFKKDGVEDTEVIPAAEIIHLKILCDSNEKRGYSWLVGLATYIKYYDEWLMDRIKLNKIRSMFNLVFTPHGVTASTFAGNFPDSMKPPATSGDIQSKKLPKPGTAIVARGMDIEFKSPDVRATDTATDGRHLERMLCKGTGLVEGVVTGDYSNNNFASSLIAESPMVKSIEEHQDVFGNLFRDIVWWVKRYGQSTGQVPLGVDDTVNTTFSSMVHRELLDDTQAYQVHKANEWASDRTIAGKLGYDYDKEQEQIEAELVVERDRARKNDGMPDEPRRPGDQEPELPREPAIPNT